MKRRSLYIITFCIISSSYIFSQINTVNVDPENQNFDTTILSELHAEINNSVYGKVHSLLVARNGDLVYEEYYNGYDQHQKHHLYSVTKTFTSALIGIAIDQGKIQDVEEYMLDFFPEYDNLSNNDYRKQTIKVKDLLTMRGGFSNESGIWDSDNYIEFMLNLAMSHPPGTVWSYSGGSSVLLSGIITNTTGESAEDFASTNLFMPLGITDWFWGKDANGITATSGGLQLRPLDMAKFGQLYLQEGVWKGHQIISKEWIDESTKVSVDHSSHDRSYGYHLYQYLDASTVAQSLSENDIFFASGSREQKIFVIPHLDLVVTMTSDNANSKSILQKILLAINTDDVNCISTDDIVGGGFNCPTGQITN